MVSLIATQSACSRRTCSPFVVAARATPSRNGEQARRLHEETQHEGGATKPNKNKHGATIVGPIRQNEPTQRPPRRRNPPRSRRRRTKPPWDRTSGETRPPSPAGYDSGSRRVTSIRRAPVFTRK